MVCKNIFLVFVVFNGKCYTSFVLFNHHDGSENKVRFRKEFAFCLFGFIVCSVSSSLSGQEVSLRSFLLRENTVSRYSYQVLESYPHDPSAFTQGLAFSGRVLYESTGLYGESSLRKVDLRTGRVTQRLDLEDEHFAEGITLWRDRIIQLTWRSGVVFIYDALSFERLKTLPYPYEGWGITTDGENLIVSDGSEIIRFLDPLDLSEKRRIEVQVAGRKIDRLNELEYAQGKIYANVWYEDLIVVIDPESGGLLGWIDLGGLDDPGKGGENVLNGIAYDGESGTFLVTGKRWHRIYRIKVLEE